MERGPAPDALASSLADGLLKSPKPLMKKQAVKRHHHKHNLRHRYEFLETLGKGTYGKVKKARERSGKLVRRKASPPPRSLGPDLRLPRASLRPLHRRGPGTVIGRGDKPQGGGESNESAARGFGRHFCAGAASGCREVPFQALSSRPQTASLSARVAVSSAFRSQLLTCPPPPHPPSALQVSSWAWGNLRRRFEFSRCQHLFSPRRFSPPPPVLRSARYGATSAEREPRLPRLQVCGRVNQVRPGDLAGALRF